MNRNPANYGSITEPEVGFSGGHNVEAEFNSLCDDIATNLYTLNSSFKPLQNSLKLIGTSKDNVGVRNNIHVTQISANQVASAIPKSLNRLRQLTPKNNKHLQLQAEKLDGDFKDTIKKYSAIQKELADKQKAHLLLTVQEPSVDEEAGSNEQQIQISRELQFEQEMLLEREQTVKQIESDVLDINQIFRDLNAMVHVQGEVINNIESNIDTTAGNVEQGTSQLNKAINYQTRYRKKLLVLVSIALLIGIILIAVLVSELKK